MEEMFALSSQTRDIHEKANGTTHKETGQPSSSLKKLLAAFGCFWPSSTMKRLLNASNRKVAISSGALLNWKVTKKTFNSQLRLELNFL